jgi:hypothetical protein
MGYGFMVWSIDTENLKSLCGSKDAALCRAVCERFEGELARLDEWGSSDGTPARDALVQIIDGAVPRGARGGVYANAFELLVEHLGRFLDNGAVYPWNSPDFTQVDGALNQMGVPFRLERFYGFSLPVKLPYPDDFPMAGWVANDETAKIAAAFQTAKPLSLDPETDRIVKCVRGWFADAARERRGLVSFYH